MTQNERRILPIWRKILVLLFTFIIFAIQISIFALMFQINYANLNWVFFSIIELIALIVVNHIIHKPILTSYKLTWSILIMAVPLPFIFLYYLTHNGRRLPRHKQKKIDEVLSQYQTENQLVSTLEQQDSVAAKLANVIYANTKFSPYQNTTFKFLKDGEDKFKDLLEELPKAERYVFIESFIISDGFLLDHLIPILESLGQNGVEIKIIYDDLGSKMTLKGKTIKRIMSIPNCQITNYNPLGLSINPAYNYRDHRKIIIIDGITAYCGGDNLADEYIHQKDRFGFWRDNCGKYIGEAVSSFVALFIETWYMSTKEILSIENYVVQTNLMLQDGYVIPFGDGPSSASNVGYECFKSLIANAKKTLYISTPYLVIDDGMIEEIALAAKSGVDVRILMPGIPDKKSAFYLAKHHYRDILKAGGKIYEFSKGFNHAKNIIVDGQYAFIGTFNMDFRSLFLHYECGAVVLLNPEIERMQEDFLEACKESKQITFEEWKKRPWYQKLIAYIFYLLAPMF